MTEYTPLPASRQTIVVIGASSGIGVLTHRPSARASRAHRARWHTRDGWMQRCRRH